LAFRQLAGEFEMSEDNLSILDREHFKFRKDLYKNKRDLPPLSNEIKNLMEAVEVFSSGLKDMCKCKILGKGHKCAPCFLFEKVWGNK